MSVEFDVTFTTPAPDVSKLDSLQDQINEFRELNAEEITTLEEILS